MYQFFIAPLNYSFMQQAMGIGLLIALTCALLSCFVVLKGWSLMGDAVSHAILPGVVFAAYFNFPLAIGAFIAGITCALSTGWLENRSYLKADTLLGVVFSSMFALGILLFAKIKSEQHLTHVLFGHLLGMENSQRLQVIIISCLVIGVLLLKRRDFMLFIFDQNHARIAGLSVKWIYFLLLILLSLTAIVALQAVGVILVVSMLITPGISAQLICKQFNNMLWVAATISIVSTLFGILISFHINASTSACIIITQAIFFLVLLLIHHLQRYYSQLFGR